MSTKQEQARWEQAVKDAQAAGVPGADLLSTGPMKIRLRVTGDRAEVAIEGNGLLAPGVYRGTVARLAGSMGKVES